jgi:hypothetical protein
VTDKTRAQEALQNLIGLLPERPKWVVLLKRSGELVVRAGEFTNVRAPFLNENLVAVATRDQALNEIQMLEKIQQGTFQFSISIGSEGVYFVFHLNDTYLLGLSYQDVGVQSFDAIVHKVVTNFYSLLETL